MGQSFRIQLLTVSCVLSFLLFLVTYVFIVVPKYCWSPDDFWLNEDVLINPFWSFAVTFGLLASWVIVETIVYWKSKTRNSYKISGLIIVYVFLAAFAPVYYTLWQSLHIFAGDLTFEDYWYIAVEDNRSSLPDVDWTPGFPSWDEFLYSERCEKGLSRNDIPVDELRMLIKKYDEIAVKALNKSSNTDAGDAGAG